MQMVGELLGITDQFLGVDEIKVASDGSFEVKERVEGGKYLVSNCKSAPAVLGWATGNLPEPPNNPQVGMINMRSIMPSLQKAAPAKLEGKELQYSEVKVPGGQRDTKVVKDVPVEEIAKEIAEWLKG